MTDRLDENERLQHGMAQWVAERIAPIQAERDALAAKLRAVEALCAYADRTQQPRPGVLGFVAPSVVNVTDIRTALSTDTTPEATRPRREWVHADGTVEQIQPATAEALPIITPEATEQDEHFPWHYTEYGTVCVCGSPMDRDENCLAVSQPTEGSEQ